MERIRKILMTVSLCFLVVCMGAAIWAAQYDPSMWMYAAVFALAIVWFSITIYKSRK